MDAAEFLGLAPTHNPMRWYLPITEGISTRGRFLFGGCGLGAAVAAMEAVCGRPAVWATAQYLSFAKVDEIMDLDVTVAVSGRHTSQVRAVGHVGDREILTVNAALGSKPIEIDQQWPSMPAVPDPEACPGRDDLVEDSSSIMTRFDVRLALGTPWARSPRPRPAGPGRVGAQQWVRMPEVDMSCGPAILVLRALRHLPGAGVVGPLEQPRQRCGCCGWCRRTGALRRPRRRRAGRVRARVGVPWAEDSTLLRQRASRRCCTTRLTGRA